jgi:hypothetical protein
LSRRDLEYLRSVGKPEADVRREFLNSTRGVPHMLLRRPCRPGDGIVQLGLGEQERLARAYEAYADRGRASKFVAASGAASRMFKSHLAYEGRPSLTRRELLAERDQGSRDADELLRFVDNLRRFPFFGELHTTLTARGYDLEQLLHAGSYAEMLKYLLSADGLGYARLPKGLVPFHLYPEGARTPLEEHLLEAASYLRAQDGTIRVHFTVSPEEKIRVHRHLIDAACRYQRHDSVYRAEVSVQDRATDAVALESDGSLARDEEGRILLWPAGHGTLIGNLNDMQGDLVFVRTIDNVLPDRLKGTVVFFKRVLGGLLAELQERVFEAVGALRSGACTATDLRFVEEWGREVLSLRLPSGYRDWRYAERVALLINSLNRPMRVCAMVKHEGEPGGGPFWVEGPGGTESLQIVEAAQVDMSAELQRRVWESSTYFNPADMVCGVRDFQGRPFDLHSFVDRNAGFISSKQYKARRVRVLERPGLWNGSMAFWNTVFVEVPKETLHPVKNVMDLLSSERAT